jgi:Flp pilus assembly CpaF family ATPase
MANIGLPHASIREAIALAVHLVVHIERVGEQRRVTELLRLAGYDHRTDQFVLSDALPGRIGPEGVAA